MRGMDRRRIIAAGAIVLFLCAMFPPWKRTVHYSDVGTKVETVGLRMLFMTPQPEEYEKPLKPEPFINVPVWAGTLLGVTALTVALAAVAKPK